MFGGKNIVGVDIGAYSVKAVAFKGGKISRKLAGAACVRIPGAERDDRIIAKMLSGVLKSARIRAKLAATAFTGASLTLRHLTLPFMPEKDLREAVRWEIRKEVPFPPAEMVSDYIVTGETGSPERKALSVIVFAARRAEVERIIELFRNASLELRVLDVTPAALFSSFSLNNEWEEGMNYALLDIGESSSTLAIVKDRRLWMTRQITFGGSDITKAVAAAIGMGDEEAEEYKITHGLGAGGGEGEKATEAFTTVLHRLCSEIHRSIDYYQAQYRGGVLAKMFVSGGTARLKGIDDFISETLGILCFVDDPLRKADIPRSMDREALSQIAPCLTVATGLALRDPV